MTKRVGIFSDPHSGSKHGLAPPEWQGNRGDEAYEGRVQLWDFFASETAAVKREKPFDIAIYPGDLVDGQGRKSHGSEQTTTDWSEQIEAACKIVETVGAPENIFITGTGYHVGDDCDYERLIAGRFGGKIYRRLQLTVNGCTFDIRHHAGRSGIPHGMNSAAKEKLWNDVMSSRGEEVRANVVLRGHTHWFRYAGEDDWLAMLLPCLELPGTRYGARCTGGYSIGFVVFDVEEDGSYTWRLHSARLSAAKVPSLKL